MLLISFITMNNFLLVKVIQKTESNIYMTKCLVVGINIIFVLFFMMNKNRYGGNVLKMLKNIQTNDQTCNFQG